MFNNYQLRDLSNGVLLVVERNNVWNEYAYRNLNAAIRALKEFEAEAARRFGSQNNAVMVSAP